MENRTIHVHFPLPIPTFPGFHFPTSPPSTLPPRDSRSHGETQTQSVAKSRTSPKRQNINNAPPHGAFSNLDQSFPIKSIRFPLFLFSLFILDLLVFVLFLSSYSSFPRITHLSLSLNYHNAILRRLIRCFRFSYLRLNQDCNFHQGRNYHLM